MVPSFLSLIMDELIWQCTLIFVGRLNDPTLLSAVGMVNNVNLLIPITFSFGTSRALGSFVSQSFGAKQYSKCAEYLNKQIILVTLAFIPLTIILLQTGNILILVGMHKEPSALAGQLMPYFIVGIYMNCMFYTIRLFLTCLENSLVPMLLQTCCLIFRAHSRERDTRYIVGHSKILR